MQNITEEQCNVIMLSTIAQQSGGSIEDRLQAIQKAFRRTNQQTVTAIDLRCEQRQQQPLSLPGQAET